MKYFIMIFVLLVNFNIFSQDATNDQQNTPTTTTIKRSLNGWDYYSMGKYEESINALVSEKKLFPDRINIYVILAWDYREIKRFKEMEEVSLEGLKIQPTDIRIIKNLAEAYFFQNKHALAISTFEKFIKYKTNWSDPYISQAYYYLGSSFFALKQFYKSDIALTASNHFQAKNFNTVLLLAEVKEQLGEFKSAYNYYTQAKQLNPTSEKSQEGITRLKDKIQ